MTDPAYDSEHCLRRYWALRRSEPELFENPEGCPTRIVVDGAEIQQIRKDVRDERVAADWPTDDLRVGVLAEDYYVGHIVRDAVRFSDGRPGLYNRVIATGGIVVLPILGDNIALIRIFRHAARRWFLEAPQGFLPRGADPAEEARRELIEEMGATVGKLTSLGVIFTSTALTSESLKMFVAEVSATGAPQLSEGIDSVRIIPKDEIDKLLLDGTICDGPTTSLITQSRLRGLL